jgi:hypothetical protein
MKADCPVQTDKHIKTNLGKKYQISKIKEVNTEMGESFHVLNSVVSCATASVV